MKYIKIIFFNKLKYGVICFIKQVRLWLRQVLYSCKQGYTNFYIHNYYKCTNIPKSTFTKEPLLKKLFSHLATKP